MKWLLWLLIVGLGFLWITRSLRSSAARQSRARAAARPEAALPPAVVMLACSHCGVHLPQRDAVLDAAQRPYCGAVHRSAGPRALTPGD